MLVWMCGAEVNTVAEAGTSDQLFVYVPWCCQESRVAWKPLFGVAVSLSQEIAKQRLSTALFAPAWAYESQGGNATEAKSILQEQR